MTDLKMHASKKGIHFYSVVLLTTLLLAGTTGCSGEDKSGGTPVTTDTASRNTISAPDTSNGATGSPKEVDNH